MTVASPPEPHALAEEARVDDLYRTIPLALWLATAVGVGLASGFVDVLEVHDAREWIPPGGTLSTWWGWQPPSLATLNASLSHRAELLGALAVCAANVYPEIRWFARLPKEIWTSSPGAARASRSRPPRGCAS